MLINTIVSHLFQYNHRSPLVLPRAYWLDPPKLASHIMVVRPAETLWKNITDYLDTKPAYQFDMDVCCRFFQSVAVLCLLLHAGYQCSFL